ncbi:hypothetical protein [Terrisporobacter sp.]
MSTEKYLGGLTKYICFKLFSKTEQTLKSLTAHSILTVLSATFGSKSAL